MDPLSISIAALTLAQTGTTLTTLLFDLGKDIKSASAAMAEVASDVELTSTVLADLAHNLESNPTGYSENFLASAKNLCDQCKIVFDEIESMLGGKDRGMDRSDWLKKVSWAVKGKKGVDEKQGRLRKLQFMFLFVSQIEMLGGGSSKQPGANGGTELTAGSLEGQLVEVPVQISGTSTTGGKEPARYMATLTLRAAPDVVERRLASHTSYARKDHTTSNRCRLVNMRRSPRFSADLIQPVPRVERLARKEKTLELSSVKYSNKVSFEDELEDVEPRIPSQKEAEEDIDVLLASWCSTPAKSKTSPSPRPSGNKSARPSPPPSPSRSSLGSKDPPSKSVVIKAPGEERSPANPPARTASVRIHEAPGLPPIKSYGPYDYPTTSTSRRPAAPSPPLPSRGGEPRSPGADPRGSGTLRTSALVTNRRTKRPKSEEIPRERVTRYYVDRRNGEVRDRDGSYL